MSATEGHPSPPRPVPLGGYGRYGPSERPTPWLTYRLSPWGPLGPLAGEGGGESSAFPTPRPRPWRIAGISLPAREASIPRPRGETQGGLTPPPCSHPWRAHYSPPPTKPILDPLKNAKVKKSEVS